MRTINAHRYSSGNIRTLIADQLGVKVERVTDQSHFMPRMKINTLIKALGVIAVLVGLVSFYSYTQKVATPVPQQAAAIQGAPPTTIPQPDTDPWIAALSAVKECKAKRLGGELKTYVQSAMCSNPGVVQAFIAVNYKHMDLIQAFAAKRLELAERLDRGQISEAQGERELSDFSNRIRGEERQ